MGIRKKTWLYTALFIVTALLLGPISAYAMQVTVTDDAYTDSANSATNFGNAAAQGGSDLHHIHQVRQPQPAEHGDQRQPDQQGDPQGLRVVRHWHGDGLPA
jgi:hypothetical protein